ncbi:MAG: ArsC family reductase [Gammaproteobacteria bacterium]|nr:ArsC family reductase [Gammaproteobacteria bacterium]MBL6998257.1 ArsC family reductase [Gammaproteobacteria bacterium]
MPDAGLMMYGIRNCDTIKKARAWLDQHAIHYQFHDYKKHGIDHDQLQRWVSELGWEQLINKRGTSWRKLDQQQQSVMDDSLAVKVMMQNPSIIRRPLLVVGEQKILGFNEKTYAQELLS